MQVSAYGCKKDILTMKWEIRKNKDFPFRNSFARRNLMPYGHDHNKITDSPIAIWEGLCYI